MAKILKDLNATTQWKSLVTDACQHLNITLPEQIESYLVFLLMRFIKSPEVAQKVLALEYLHSINQYGTQRTVALREVGDQCLLYSGLFPERARRKRVRVSYFINIGKTAYQYLSMHDKNSSCNLYANLAHDFVALMDIMHAMREVDSQIPTLDPMIAEELWRDTGSNHALHTLRQFTLAPPLISDNVLSIIKH